MKPWILAENNYAHIKEQTYEVAVLPLGATEPHNLHLPYGTDIFEADIVGDRICAAAHLFLCNWYQVIDDVYFEIFEKSEDHAGEMETSFGLAFFPDLVAQNEDGSLAADDGAVNQTEIEALNKGWVSITRPWHLLTKNSGAADPHAATAEKGQKMMEVLVARLGQFLIDLSREEITDRFP